MNPDDVLTIQEQIFLVVFFALVFVIPALVVWATYCSWCSFDVRSLWIYQERIDKFAVIVMCTWWVHTCVIILSALRGNVSTGDLVSYTAWVAPIIAKIFAPSAGSSTTSTTSTTSTEVAHVAAAPDPSKSAPQK